MDLKGLITTSFREGEAFGFDTALGIFRLCLRENIPVRSAQDAIDLLEQYDRIPSKDTPK